MPTYEYAQIINCCSLISLIALWFLVNSRVKRVRNELSERKGWDDCEAHYKMMRETSRIMSVRESIMLDMLPDMCGTCTQVEEKTQGLFCRSGEETNVYNKPCNNFSRDTLLYGEYNFPYLAYIGIDFCNKVCKKVQACGKGGCPLCSAKNLIVFGKRHTSKKKIRDIDEQIYNNATIRLRK